MFDNTEIPVVSICCITYNHSKFIRDCIQGFLIQKTSFPIEILIFDDASTDNTANILQEFTLNNENIILFLQSENQWKKNKFGIKDWLLPNAKGKYIAFCEGDDYWTDPHKLQKQVDFLESNSTYIGTFHRAHFLNERNGADTCYPVWYKEKVEFTDALREWLIPTNTLMFRNTNDFPFSHFENKLTYSGDRLMHLLLTDKGPIHYMHETMSVYRIHNAGATADASYHNYEGELRYFKLLTLVCDVVSPQNALKIKEYIYRRSLFLYRTGNGKKKKEFARFYLKNDLHSNYLGKIHNLLKWR
ncbi:MAG: glycosyltransferase [Flavobacteriales bacterium]|nr:glycosyltransferase [Flavobacteriales bacterium]